MLLDGSVNDTGYGITTDTSGNMYVTGQYNSTTTVQINNLALSSTPVSSGYTFPASTGTGAAFVLKYNSSGTFLGSTLLDGTGTDVGLAVAVDSSGNMYVTGYYTSTTTVQINNLALNSTPQSSGFTFPAASTQAAFVLKYNSIGTLAGSMILDGTGTDAGYGIEVNKMSADVYVTGQYTSTTTTQINNLALNSTPQSSGYTFPASTNSAAFVLKYSFSDTTLIQKNIYLQSPGNYYTINDGPSFLTVGPTSNVISADWTLDRWELYIA